MSLLSKLRAAQPRESPARGHQPSSRGPTQPLHAPAARVSAAREARPGRFSNGLKEFLWQLEGLGHGRLLDLGPVWQATVSFFIERGFKVNTEDLLGAWHAFLRAEEDQLRAAPPGAELPDPSSSARAERFLESNLRHSPNTFDAVLLWDALDYFDREAASRIVPRIASLVRDGGSILAVFHTRMPESFHRYRVLDAQHLEVLDAPRLLAPQSIYQNREIQDLFQGFRSSKTFVGRDQLREGVFNK